MTEKPEKEFLRVVLISDVKIISFALLGSEYISILLYEL